MDERKLLLLIKNHPEVYNPNHKHYRRLEVRRAAWREIALEMNEDESYCKKRWKNIRAVAVRDFLDPNKISDYYLKEYLDFCLPYIKSGQFYDASATNDNTEEAENEAVEEEALEEEESEIIEPTTSMLRNKIREPSPQPKRFRRSGSPTKILKKEKQPQPTFEDQTIAAPKIEDHSQTIATDEIGELNCEKAFLISILEDFKTLDARKKRVFKGKVMNLLNDLHDAMLTANHSKEGDSRSVEFTIECGNMKWSTTKVSKGF